MAWVKPTRLRKFTLRSGLGQPPLHILAKFEHQEHFLLNQYQDFETNPRTSHQFAVLY